MNRSLRALATVAALALSLGACNHVAAPGSEALSTRSPAACVQEQRDSDAAQAALLAAQSQQNTGCTAQGGQVTATGTCVCTDGTPVFKLHGAACPTVAPNSDGCSAQNGVLDDGGTCVCADGTPVFKLHGAACVTPANVQNESCSALGGRVGSDGMCRCGDATPVFKLHGGRCPIMAKSDPTTPVEDLATLRQRAADLATKLQQCQSAQAASAPDLCAGAGGKLDASNVCRCDEGTPVFKIGNSTCEAFVAAHPKDNCTVVSGTLGSDNVCRCVDGTPVFRIGNLSCEAYIATHPTGTDTGSTTSTGTGTGTRTGTRTGTTTNKQPTACVCGMTAGYCAIGIPGQRSLSWTPATTCTVAQCQLYFTRVMTTTCRGIWYHGRER